MSPSNNASAHVALYFIITVVKIPEGSDNKEFLKCWHGRVRVGGGGGGSLKTPRNMLTPVRMLF